MIYVYAITDARPPALMSTGIGGARVESTAAAGLYAVCSVHADEADVAPAPDALWAHEAVVDELLSTNTVLPLRFGTTLGDADALRDLLRREQGRFCNLLDRVRGHVELAVRVALPDPDGDVEAPADGAVYLKMRAANRQAREAAAQIVLAPLDDLATASSHRQDDAAVLRASYLVRPEEVARFAAEVRRLQDAHPQLTVSCTGPWAPYSFVRERAR
ncbi:MAG TPA: GvpL/GvpF family gas vesicle protein [Thermoleophilaceae bacterium]|jgi:hypothetical protein|nr:GvpL/GvpF family gas vesicle protein [Thermoleophilaceae bacterium]